MVPGKVTANATIYPPPMGGNITTRSSGASTQSNSARSPLTINDTKGSPSWRTNRGAIFSPKDVRSAVRRSLTVLLSFNSRYKGSFPSTRGTEETISTATCMTALIRWLARFQAQRLEGFKADLALRIPPSKLVIFGAHLFQSLGIDNFAR